MNIILIADSGSTKTDWAIRTSNQKDSDVIPVVQTQGINPIHQDDEKILAILRDELLPHLSSPHYSFSSLHFYGAGVRPEQETRMERLLRTVFPEADMVEAKSDLLGAARALCGHNEGLACILGTGANSCLYDGEQIVKNTPALGYILGDEGSGAVMGRLFVNALYKDGLYTDARQEFEHQTGLTMSDIIDRVYRQPMANRWLASLSEYIHSHLYHPEVNAIVIENFSNFIRRNIRPYHRPDLPINAVGSIAYYYRDQFLQAAMAEGYTLGIVMRSPLPSLTSFHYPLSI